MSVLAILQHEEQVRLDSIPLAALYSELGERGADRVICLATEELASRLTDIFRQAEQSRGDSLMRSSRLLSKVAGQMGMVTLARVANDLVATTAAADSIGQAATLARLMRIGERSLATIWTLRKITN